MLHDLAAITNEGLRLCAGMHTHAASIAALVPLTALVTLVTNAKHVALRQGSNAVHFKPAEFNVMPCSLGQGTACHLNM